MDLVVAAPNMTLTLVNRTKFRCPNQYLKMWLQYIQVMLNQAGYSRKLKAKELIIVFLPVNEARSLNYKFRKKNKATDVLSFEAIDADGLGELIMCPTVIGKEAKENKLSFRDQTVYLMIHGILHLLGFEHEENIKAAKKMFALQDKIFFNGLQNGSYRLIAKSSSK